MKSLFQEISQHIFLTPALKQALEGRLIEVSFAKGVTVLHPHEVCTKSYFIRSGVMRLFQYHLDREQTTFFAGENTWINAPQSFTEQRADGYAIDTLESTRAWSLHVRDLSYLFREFPDMEKYVRQQMNQSFQHMMERMSTLSFASAREKYAYFLQTHPNLHHRLPLGMVASYLGMAQETLSRIRREETF